MNKNKSHVLLIILEFVFVLCFVFSSICLGFYLSQTHCEKVKSQEASEQIREPSDISSETEIEKFESNLTNYFQKNKTINSDTVGVLCTTNYATPVVQCSNNDYYLKKGIDNKYNFYGTPFLDYRNDSKNLNPNTIIYGHNMNNDRCFGYIKELFENFPSTNLYLYINNIAYQANFVSALYTDKLNNDQINKLLQTNFNNEEDFNEYLSIVTEYSVGNFTNSLNFTDKILTLFTCAYNSENSRYLMIFTLTEIQNEEVN